MAETNKTLEDMERLFLLELLVDSVQINYDKVGLDQCELSNLKQACVRFQFLNYPVLEICEDDFCNVAEDYQRNEIEFKSGKSCLFSLRGIPPDVRCFEICVSVLRQKGAGSCVLLGRTRISLGSSFTNILTAMENDCSSGPIARTSKDTHPLLNEKGEIAGKITVFVRLSCFGKMIITQFQVSGEENKSFLFKGASETKALSDPGALGDQSALCDPFARGTPGGDTDTGVGYPAQAPQDIMSQHFGEENPIYPPGYEEQYAENMKNAQQVIEQNMGSGMGGTSGGMPGMGGNMPGMGGNMPGMGGNMPGMGGNMPGMGGNMPGMGGYMPGMGGNMPGMGGNMPGMGGNMPGMTGFMPGMTGSMPGMAGGLPGFMPGMPGMAGNVSSMPQGPGGEPTEDLPEKDYKEIGVEINGHSLSIKIPRREKKPKSDVPQMPFCGKIPIASSESSSESSGEDESTVTQQPQSQVPGIEFCSCDYPLPPGFGCPPPPPAPKKKKKKKKPKCPLELKGNYCMKPDCPMGYPMLPDQEKKPGCPQFEMPAGAVGVKGDQIVFQMPTGRQGNFPGNTNATYNFGGNVDTNLQKVQMMNDAQAGKSVVPEPSNDVFLLKVGKKNVATDRRAKMEVEIKSPRKEEPKMVDEQTQYIDADSGLPEEKPAKGKGGKGKKGKGKK